METKVNYTMVGLFVLLLMAAAIIIPLWLSSGLNQQQYQRYLINMDEAVDGLSLNSSVKYNGVDVGRVKDISLNPKNTQQVIVLVDIKSGTPITTNTTATLQSQGVTGVDYIGLKGGPSNGAKPLVALPGQPYPIIPATPSIKLRLDIAITQLMNIMQKLSTQLDNILTPENQQLFTSTLHNINQFSIMLAKDTTQFDGTIKSTNIVLQNMSQTTAAVPSTLNQIQAVLQNMQTITNEIKQNPSVIIRGKANTPPGPGEEGNN